MTQQTQRITDHAYVPPKCCQVADQCQYGDCRKPELEHEWTVESGRPNPPMPRVQ